MPEYYGLAKGMRVLRSGKKKIRLANPLLFGAHAVNI
jgi:hypothetical protein